ncbi:MAG: cytochrome c biogenesis protein CcdA [Lachnospiraceae bacterium]|nr:cytochrome c biogenesis protein CcdA [Lachnospiraceae bacterium]
MQYLLLFLEGIITFISPCFLPLLPMYISYLAKSNETGEEEKSFLNAIGFVLGFSLVFIALGAFAGSLGGLLRDYSIQINIITGLIVVMFGLNYLGIFRFRFPSFSKRLHEKWADKESKTLHFPSAFLFGMIFSITWTPCVGAFLGAALLRAAGQGSLLEGMMMLFVFSMGIGIPFIVSAMLISRLKVAFSFIKKHYRVINAFSGGLLIVIGILMMTGIFGRFIMALVP